MQFHTHHNSHTLQPDIADKPENLFSRQTRRNKPHLTRFSNLALCLGRTDAVAALFPRRSSRGNIHTDGIVPLCICRRPGFDNLQNTLLPEVHVPVAAGNIAAAVRTNTFGKMGRSYIAQAWNNTISA